MQLYLKNNEPIGFNVEKEFLDRSINYDGEILEITTNLEKQFGNGLYKEIYFEGVRIGFGNAILRKSVQLNFESNVEMIEMHFAIRGRSISETDRFDKRASFLSNQHNIIYTNGISGHMQLDCCYYQRLEVNLSPGFFKRFFPERSQLADKFRDFIEKRRSCLLFNNHNLINHKMYDLLYDIINCQRQGIYKRIFLEAKVIELLLLQLEQVSDKPLKELTIKKVDGDKIHAVKEFILQHIDSDYSLIELAHMVGTNEFILKKGFKELFGTTVFAFWNDTKMEHAKKLLMESNLNAREVAELIGYKNQRHFSTAFKKKFGMLPSIYKKSSQNG